MNICCCLHCDAAIEYCIVMGWENTSEKNNPDMLLRHYLGSLFLLGAILLSAQTLLCSLDRTLTETFLPGSSYCLFKGKMLFHR